LGDLATGQRKQGYEVFVLHELAQLERFLVLSRDGTNDLSPQGGWYRVQQQHARSAHVATDVGADPIGLFLIFTKGVGK
jgi:hypothetical protein